MQNFWKVASDTRETKSTADKKSHNQEIMQMINQVIEAAVERKWELIKDEPQYSQLSSLDLQAVKRDILVDLITKFKNDADFRNKVINLVKMRRSLIAQGQASDLTFHKRKHNEISSVISATTSDKKGPT